MKKQINPTIKAYLIRGAFYLLLLLAVCAIPFALAQRTATSANRNATGAAKPDATCEEVHGSRLSPRIDRSGLRQQPLPKIPAHGRRRSLPKASHRSRLAFLGSGVTASSENCQQVVLYDRSNNTGWPTPP